MFWKKWFKKKKETEEAAQTYIQQSHLEVKQLPKLKDPSSNVSAQKVVASAALGGATFSAAHSLDEDEKLLDELYESNFLYEDELALYEEESTMLAQLEEDDFHDFHQQMFRQEEEFQRFNNRGLEDLTSYYHSDDDF